MSMEVVDQNAELPGTPELTPLGKRIEMLRIERGLSKQQLAKAAGISRQQLWRVLAGKSELTGSLRERLAFVLQTDAAVLREEVARGDEPRHGLAGWLGAAPRPIPLASDAAPRALTFADFTGDPALVRVLLAACPTCDDGVTLKRALLDAIEDIAIAKSFPLPSSFFELRRGVISREL